MFDPKSTPRTAGFAASISSPALRKESHPWAWIIGLIVTLLLIWGFFGTDHLKVDADPGMSPTAIEATVE